MRDHPKHQHLRRIRRPRLLTAAAAAGLAVSTLTVMGTADAAVPTFPDNIVVFPDRDFVSVEGFSTFGGSDALVEVIRNGKVMGSAVSRVSGTDVAFEVNHPGGVCWGAGTSHNVTPDIRPGDVVQLTLSDGHTEETTVGSATVTESSTLVGTTLTVRGSLGPDVNPAQMEQRVVEPALTDTDVQRRDIRAVPGPMTRAPKGGYSSRLEVNGTSFVATYEFDQASTAAIADAAEFERAMSWQQEDADGNRQGLTISEYLEHGGPGMGGCPAGPSGQDAPEPGSASVVRPASDPTRMQVKWTPATTEPGAPEVTGYSVVAIAATADNGQQVQLGKRTDAGATQTTITGLDAAEQYTVEVRSITGARMSPAYTLTTGGGGGGGGTPGDTTVPTLELSPAPDPNGADVEADQVTVTSDGQVFYTTDGSPAITGDMPADNAQLYTGPIPVKARTELRVAAFDQVGNHDEASGFYVPPATTTQPPAAPTGLTAEAGQEMVTLRWDNSGPEVAAYAVTVYESGVTDPVVLPELTARVQTIEGLKAGVLYEFTVRARKEASDFGPESAKVGATPLVKTDQVSIGTARWKARDFRVTGSGSVVGAQVTVHRANADGTIGAVIPGAVGPVTAAVPPAIGEYDIRLRNGAAPATNPGRIFVKSDHGGVAGPFTVEAR